MKNPIPKAIIAIFLFLCINSHCLAQKSDCVIKLIEAAERNDLTTAKQLLKKGCNVNGTIETQPGYYLSPLRSAIHHPEMVKLLLKHGANPTQHLGKELTAFHYSAGASPHDVFSLLLNKCDDVNGSNTASDFETPLIFAIAQGKTDNVKSLLDEGAKTEPDTLLLFNSSPLGVACSYNQIGIMELLLDRGANINSKFSESAEDCNPCPYGITLLHQITNMSSNSLLDWILKYNPDMNIESEQGITALGLACYKQDTVIVDKLIQQGASMDTKTFSALHCAALYSNDIMVEYLLKKGANPNGKDINGDTPLLLSYTCCGDGMSDGVVFEKRIKTIQLLIRYGADPNIKNNNNTSFNDFWKNSPEGKLRDEIAKMNLAK